MTHEQLLQWYPEFTQLEPLATLGQAKLYRLESDYGAHQQLLVTPTQGDLLHQAHVDQSLANLKNSHCKALRLPKKSHYHEGYRLDFYADYGGQTLADFVQSQGPLSDHQALDLLKSLSDAIQTFQPLHLIYCQMSPCNIWHSVKGFQLMNFNPLLSQSGYYEMSLLAEANETLAPEIWQGQIQQPAAIYAVGLTLYFALSGKHLWVEHPPGASRVWAQVQTIPDLSAVPARWRLLIGRCLEKDPKWRPQAEHLTELLDLVWQGQHKPTKPLSPYQALIALGQMQVVHANYLLARQQLSKSPEEAFKTLVKLAMGGYVLAQYTLGVCYQLGKGVKPDIKKAQYFWSRAAQKGHPHAMLALAILIKTRVQQAPFLSVIVQNFLQMAAKKGVVKAQEMLVEFYEQQQDEQAVTKAQYWRAQIQCSNS